MDKSERGAAQKQPLTVCSLCGKAFGFWDAVQDFSVDNYIGYGSKYDLCRIKLYLCCGCLDRVLDWLIPQCVHNPMEECDNTSNTKDK